MLRRARIAVFLALAAIIFGLLMAHAADGNSGITKINETYVEFEGVYVLESLDDARDAYRISVLSRYNFSHMYEEEPSYDIFLSLIGDGHIPDLKAYKIANGFAWKFEGWLSLPYDLTYESKHNAFSNWSESPEFLLSHYDVEKSIRKFLCVSLSPEEVRLAENCRGSGISDYDLINPEL